MYVHLQSPAHSGAVGGCLLTCGSTLIKAISMAIPNTENDLEAIPLKMSRINIRISPKDRIRILDLCQRAGMPLSEFIRRACLGAEFRSTEDVAARQALQKDIADLGRLGGLLKQTISVVPAEKWQINSLLRQIDVCLVKLRETLLTEK